MLRTKGFTLIELLVVIAIIAILAAILFPVFAMAKERANQTKCLSNMKQIGTAMMNYVDDWNGAMPLPCNSGYSWDRDTWRERLFKYTKSKKIFKCPKPNKVNPASGLSHYGVGFSLTHQPQTRQNSYCGAFGFSYMVEILQPSQTIMIAENQDGDWSAEPDGAYYGDSGDAGHFYPYHMSNKDARGDKKGGANFTFCDGHAKYMTIGAAEKNHCYLWWKDKSIIAKVYGTG